MELADVELQRRRASLPETPLSVHRSGTRASKTVARQPAILTEPATRAHQAQVRKPSRVRLTAADGYALTGVHFPPRQSCRGSLVIAGAVGVGQQYYRRFACFAAESGLDTLTFDYRGIGASAPPSLRGFRMDFFDWGRLDLAAAVEAMHDPHRPLYIVGHSYGGHAFGMLPEVERVRACYGFGIGAGWHGWMPTRERLRVLCMWHLLGPVLTARYGYLRWGPLGYGHDLPLDFYRQWKRACRHPNYFLGEPSMQETRPDYTRVTAPLMAANAVDDRWSPPRSRDAFIGAYANAARETLDIEPQRLGLRRVGHMGYFAREAQSLWESALQWLERHAASAPASQ